MWEKINNFLKGQIVTSIHIHSPWCMSGIYAGQYCECNM